MYAPAEVGYALCSVAEADAEAVEEAEVVYVDTPSTEELVDEVALPDDDDDDEEEEVVEETEEIEGTGTTKVNG